MKEQTIGSDNYMSWARIIVALAFVAINLGVALWDLYCLGMGKPLDTVSFVMHEWGRDFPVLPLLLGIVIGHVFWPQGR